MAVSSEKSPSVQSIRKPGERAGDRIAPSFSRDAWNSKKIKDCSRVIGADLRIARQGQGGSTRDPLHDSELALDSANGLIPSLIAWTVPRPPGNQQEKTRDVNAINAQAIADYVIYLIQQDEELWSDDDE